jgi:hypothetical protein
VAQHDGRGQPAAARARGGQQRFRVSHDEAPYSPALFAELPRSSTVAADLASREHGTVKSRATTRLQGQKVRQYVIAYKKGDEDVSSASPSCSRAGQVRHLLCQWKASDDEPTNCGRQLKTFKLS